MIVGSAGGRHHHVHGLVETVELIEGLLQLVGGIGVGTLASGRHHLEEQA